MHLYKVSSVTMKNLTIPIILSIIIHFVSAQQYEALQCIDSTVQMGVKRNPKNNNKLVFKTCAWANPWRCRTFPGLAEACPLSCNKCEVSECKDSPFYFRYPLANGELSGKTRLCSWVATGNTRKKCKRPGVSQMCRETCTVCAKQSCYAAYPDEEERYITYRLGNGYCDNYGVFNTPECGEDGGDCSGRFFCS